MNEPTQGDDARDEGRQYTDGLLALGSTLARVAGPVGKVGGAHAERAFNLLIAAQEALRAAAGRLTTRSSGPPGDAAAVRAWLHELRTPATAMAGWAQLLTYAQDETTQVRATQAIERNAERLRRLLSEPPA
jgi:signal transduction histidine kinase